MTAKKRAQSSPRVVITQKVTTEPTPKWKTWAERLILAAAAAGAASFFWNYAQPIAESGPAPFPSRAEVVKVDGRVSETQKNELEAHQRIINQLDSLDASAKATAAQQRTLLADTLVNRMRSLQSSIEVAKANNDKEPSLANQRVLEALQMQMSDLQRQLMELPPK